MTAHPQAPDPMLDDLADALADVLGCHREDVAVMRRQEIVVLTPAQAAALVGEVRRLRAHIDAHCSEVRCTVDDHAV